MAKARAQAGITTAVSETAVFETVDWLKRRSRDYQPEGLIRVGFKSANVRERGRQAFSCLKVQKVLREETRHQWAHTQLGLRLSLRRAKTNFDGSEPKVNRSWLRPQLTHYRWCIIITDSIDNKGYG